MRVLVGIGAAALVLTVAGCSGTQTESTVSANVSVESPAGLNVGEVCAAVAAVEADADKVREQEAQIQENIRNLADEYEAQGDSDAALVKRADLRLHDPDTKAFERITTSLGSLWPKIDDPDLRRIIEDLSKNRDWDANVAALNGFCQ